MYELRPSGPKLRPMWSLTARLKPLPAQPGPLPPVSNPTKASASPAVAQFAGETASDAPHEAAYPRVHPDLPVYLWVLPGCTGARPVASALVVSWSRHSHPWPCPCRPWRCYTHSHSDDRRHGHGHRHGSGGRTFSLWPRVVGIITVPCDRTYLVGLGSMSF